MIAIQETYSLSSGTTTSHYTIHDHLCKHLRSYDGDESFGNHWKTLRFDHIKNNTMGCRNPLLVLRTRDPLWYQMDSLRHASPTHQETVCKPINRLPTLESHAPKANIRYVWLRKCQWASPNCGFIILLFVLWWEQNNKITNLCYFVTDTEQNNKITKSDFDGSNIWWIKTMQ